MRSDPLGAAFTALADRTRRSVVDLLRRGPRRAGELAADLDVSAPALSRHLRILRESRLVEETGDEGDGRVSVYRLRRETFTALRGWVDEVEALWQDQLASFAAHVGRTRGKRKT
ncbi:MAG: metalloregulator ArsR/SmtB family transcription factor [Planctomycetota bacterium]|nr:metalloregulator ArsR/SmtB family transcription factor [Planctomycetota bacterium]